ncbi:hypothetical protein GE061_007691 [Apolygus lucorum]|uniref:TERF2-interacting telomeric protein 1 Myb domain-containing protein n=1 Tax=Apolygus lucorum TaxID=248454 RepID=A0A6A4IZW2_APOLU|nr:hypothetical protein GE061_007691 [Apolygus lucorum]
MDIAADIRIDDALQVANPVLFCTKFGGPMTFHLQVGEGEGNLIASVEKAIDASGGRYIKQYHEMTPYTVLLVTDLGFKSGTFNRPALCVTYIGDCVVHSNYLRNLNDYLHPWEDLDRWSDVNLFDVVYSNIKMFRCSSSNTLHRPYIPVSHAPKKQISKCFKKQPSRTPTLLEISSESSEVSEFSSEDDDLFIRAPVTKKSLSVASTNVRSSSSVHVETESPLETNSPDSKHHPTNKNEINPVSVERGRSDDGSSDSMKCRRKQFESTCPEGSKSCTRPSKMPLKSTLRKEPSTARNPHQLQAVNISPAVLIYRLPEDMINDVPSNSSDTPLQVNPKTIAGRSISSESSKSKTVASGAARVNLPARNKALSYDVGSPRRLGAKTSSAKPSGNSDGCTVQKRASEDVAIKSISDVPSCSGNNSKSAKTAKSAFVHQPVQKAGEDGTAMLCLPISNSSQIQPSCNGLVQSKANTVAGKSEVSAASASTLQSRRKDRESSSPSDVECVAPEIPSLDVSDDSVTSFQRNSENEKRAPLLTSPLLTLKEKIKEEPVEIKKRGRGYQDRYRRSEKVALLKWLVEHKKFKNLKGVLVWREIERKKVLPGRSHESMKNHFLKHLLRSLDGFPFLTDEDKRKLRGENDRHRLVSSVVNPVNLQTHQ